MAPASALDEAIGQAVAWGLVDESDIVDGDLLVSSSARRNLNLRIERRLRPSYLVKRADLASAGLETVSNESAFYRFCAQEPAAAGVAASMPRLVATFESDRVLALELVRGARSLWQAYRTQGPPELPTDLCRELGQVLGTLHATFSGKAPAGALRPPGLRRGIPGVFALHEPHTWMLRTASPARLELCRCLQHEIAFCRGLPAARGAWREETVIHGDIRSENLLVVAGVDEARRLLLVDWELVQLGDPAWDLAAAFEDHIRFWLENMSQRPDLAPAARLATARWPLTAVQAAVRELCTGYAEAVALSPRDLAPRLVRAVAFSAARLLQTAWEHCRYLERLSSLSVLLVQIAANILSDPERTARELYGLGEVIGLEAPRVG